MHCCAIYVFMIIYGFLRQYLDRGSDILFFFDGPEFFATDYEPCK